ncbi:serine/threonine-protein kinase, partial [Streptomyces sp. S6]
MAESRLIQGRYRLLELIGRGGMGEVWRAKDESLGRQVAVKCLKPPGPHHDPGFTRVLRERFRREARVAAGLQHRGVTVVHDFGEADGVLYLVMEFLDGRNLCQILTATGHRPLPVPDVADIAGQLAAALDYTHRRGIVHRDLKPANVVRLDDGTVKICDFGIARLGHDIAATSRLTGTGVAMGTPHYMSPEQIAGTEVDRRSDLYSLGCVLYELATGAPPFAMDDAWAVLIGHRDSPPRPPGEHRPELPAYLGRVILDLLAKEPDGRPGDAGEVVRRITFGRTSPGYVPTVVTARPEPLEPDFGNEPQRPRPVTDPRLPLWSRGMGEGPRATGAPPVPDTPLSGDWTRRPALGVVPGTQEVPDAPQVLETPDHRQRQQSPLAEQLTALARRHAAGLRLGRLDRWPEAGELHRTVAAERARLLGADHPDTLTSRYEAAFALSRTGRAQDALREYRQVAAARARTLGDDHPDTLAARHETAYVLGKLGRHLEAHQTYTAVLAARDRTLGADHPDTLRCRHNLAFNLGRLGRLTESYRTAREVAAARARVLGPEHPDTLLTWYEVAYTLGQLARWPEALAGYADVAEARARVLGPDHPDTLAARYETGISLGRLGRSAE